MGNTQTVNKINFEDIQYLQKSGIKYLIISTLPENEQHCLIKGTIDPVNEVKIINNYLSKEETIYIIVYGKNNNDTTTMAKYNSLITLGFKKVYLYSGGLFEWVCLQDIYGFEDFPTTSKELDLLKFKSRSMFNNLLLTDMD